MAYRDYVEKSHESLKSARILFEAECFNSCINRLYYAMFQMAVAILIKFGIKSPKESEYGHAWVQAALAKELIYRRKLIPGKFSSYLPSMMELRREADYKETSLSKKRTERGLKHGMEFIQILERIIG